MGVYFNKLEWEIGYINSTWCLQENEENGHTCTQHMVIHIGPWLWGTVVGWKSGLQTCREEGTLR